MSRLFWLGLGVAAGVVINRKVNETARQLTPAGAAANVGDALRELASAVGGFGAEVRIGMAEREYELRDMVEARTGLDTARHPAPSYRALPPADETGRAARERLEPATSAPTSRARRARRAGG